MAEMIMKYKGSGEDFSSLEKVGDLIRCMECRYYDAGHRCTHPDGLDDAKDTDYCSRGDINEHR